MDQQPTGSQPPSAPPQKPSYGSKYGKRPLWQWILLYVVVGGIIYALVYYFVLAKRGGYQAPAQTGAQNAPPPSSPY